MRNKITVCLLVLTSIVGLAITGARATHSQTQGIAPTDPADLRIPRNAKVYMVPMDGFEQYLAAAFRKKSVPLLIVVDRDLADFEISGTHEKNEAVWANTIFLRPLPSVAASFQIVNMKTRVVVYADTSHRFSAFRGERSTAEKLAKYLKRKMEKDEKKARQK